MANAQIRVNKTPALEKIIAVLQQYYPVMTDADIIKLGVSELYAKIKKERDHSFAVSLTNLPVEEILDADFSVQDISHEKSIPLSREEMWKTVA